MTDILYKTESYKLVGILFEILNYLGKGFSEIVYKDALEYEFKNSLIPFEREKEYAVAYKDSVLKHKFYADFIVYDKIILEIKSFKSLNDEYLAQCINYLKVSTNKLAILFNFNHSSLEYKRIIL